MTEFNTSDPQCKGCNLYEACAIYTGKGCMVEMRKKSKKKSSKKPVDPESMLSDDKFMDSMFPKRKSIRT